MYQPIPPYLLAFAVGELGWKGIVPRTRIYTEDDVGMLEEAAWEFTGAKGMIREGERLFRGYKWKRFDLLIFAPELTVWRGGESSDGIPDSHCYQGGW